MQGWKCSLDPWDGECKLGLVSETGSFHLKLSELGVKVVSLVWFLSSFLICSWNAHLVVSLGLNPVFRR